MFLIKLLIAIITYLHMSNFRLLLDTKNYYRRDNFDFLVFRAKLHLYTTILTRALAFSTQLIL